MGLKGFIRKLVAQTKLEITQKPIDVYTIYHLISGIVIYLCFSSILDIFFGISNKYAVLLTVLILAITWEYIENFIISKTRFKFNRMKDSLRNSLTDIVATGIGGFIPFVDKLTGNIILISLIVMRIYNWVRRNVKK